MNLGSVEEQKKTTMNIKSIIEDINQNISRAQKTPNLQSSLFSKGNEYIFLLNNAFKTFEVEAEEDCGLIKHISRNSIKTDFIAKLETIKKKSMEKLEEISKNIRSEERENWSFQNLADSMGAIWNQIYYNLKLYNMHTIKNKVASKEYNEVVNDRYNSMVKDNCLESNFIAKFTRELIGDPSFQPEDYERVEFSVFKDFDFPDCKAIQMVQDLRSNPISDEQVEEQRSLCIHEDQKRIDLIFKKKEEYCRKKVLSWLEDKKRNNYGNLGNQIQYNEKSLMDVFDLRIKNLRLTRGFHSYNYYMMLHKIIFESTNENKTEKIINKISEEYKTYKRSNVGNPEIFLKKVESKIPGFIEETKKDLFCLFYGPNKENFFNYVSDSIEEIFKGLYSNFYGVMSKSFWNEEEFFSEGRKRLEEIKTKQFNVDVTLIKRFMFSIDERIQSRKFLCFDDESKIEKFDQYYVMPTSRNEIIQNIINSDFLDQSLSVSTEYFNQSLQSLLQILLELKIINNFEEKTFLLVTDKKSLEHELGNLSWNFEDFNFYGVHQDLEYLIYLKTIFTKKKTSDKEAIEQKGTFFWEKIVKWKPEYIANFLKSEALSTSFSIKDKDFNYFFFPNNESFIEKIETVFRTILNTDSHFDTLLDEIFKKTEKLFPKLTTKDELLQIFEMNINKLKNIKNDVIEPIIRELSEEASFHGASLEKSFIEMIIILTCQRVKTYFKDNITKAVEVLIEDGFKVEAETLLENFKVKEINKDIRKYKSNQYQEFFGKCKDKLIDHFKKNFKKTIENNINQYKDQFKDKKSLIKAVEQTWFKEMESPINEENYKKFMDYFWNPTNLIKAEFEKRYETKIASIVDERKKKEFENLVLMEINQGCIFLQNLKEFLIKNGLFYSNQLEYKFELNTKISEKEKTDLKADFHYYLLNYIIEWGKIRDDYSKKIRKTKISLNLKAKNKNLKKKHRGVFFTLTRSKIRIFDIDIFIDQMLEFLKNIKKEISSNESLKKDLFSLSEFKNLKNEFKEFSIGCTEKCPCCNRLCEGQKGHEGKHSCHSFGHGIMNIHLANTEKKQKFSQNNILGWGSYLPMGFKLCDQVWGENDEIVLLQSREIKWVDVKKMYKDRNWDFKKGNQSGDNEHQKKFKEVCKNFWKSYGQMHCKLSFYLHKESTPAPFFSFIVNSRKIGEHHQERANLRRDYLKISSDVKNFAEEMFNKHRKTQICFFEFALMKDGSEVLMKYYPKIIYKRASISQNLIRKNLIKKNKKPKKMSFNPFIEVMIQNFVKHKNNVHLFVFVTEDLKKLSFENLTHKSILDISERSDKFYAIVIPSNTDREKKSINKIKEFFTPDCVKILRPVKVKSMPSSEIFKRVRSLTG